VRTALHAEWTKMRTVAGPRWLLLATVVLTATVRAAAARAGLTGVEFGQAPVAVLAVLAISGEYSSGTIRISLTAKPRRIAVLAAKAVTLGAAVAVAGIVAVLGSPVDSVLHLVLIALLGLGIATLVRDSASSIGIVLGLLYVFPILAEAVGDPRWQHLLQRISPTTAGLGVTTGWAAAALLAGGVRLCRRDA
jgi:ABC-2 type transport system permease protein